MKKPKSNLRFAVYLASAITFLNILALLGSYYSLTLQGIESSFLSLSYNLWFIMNVINIVPSSITTLFATYISDINIICYSVYLIVTFLQYLAIFYLLIWFVRREYSINRK